MDRCIKNCEIWIYSCDCVCVLTKRAYIATGRIDWNELFGIIFLPFQQILVYFRLASDVTAGIIVAFAITAQVYTCTRSNEIMKNSFIHNHRRAVSKEAKKLKIENVKMLSFVKLKDGIMLSFLSTISI